MSTYDPTKYTDVMIDLETLGTAPGSAIIALGAVFFAEGMPEEEWAVYDSGPISWASNNAIGLTTDTSTVEWWSMQVDAARVVYDAAMRMEPLAEHVVTVLQAFAWFFPLGARLWGNGASFDAVLLRRAYAQAAVVCPWQYWDESCYRTMKNRFGNVPKPSFQGVQHNALADALHQTRHLQAILAHIKELEQYVQGARSAANALRARQALLRDEDRHCPTCERQKAGDPMENAAHKRGTVEHPYEEETK